MISSLICMSYFFDFWLQKKVLIFFDINFTPRKVKICLLSIIKCKEFHENQLKLLFHTLEGVLDEKNMEQEKIGTDMYCFSGVAVVLH